MEQSPENFNCSQDCVKFWMNGTSDSSTLSTTQHNSWVWTPSCSNTKISAWGDWRHDWEKWTTQEESCSHCFGKPHSQTSHKPTCHHRDSFAGTGCKFYPDPNHCSISCPLQHVQGKQHLPVVNRLTVQAVSVPVGTLLSSLALSFYPEGTDVRTVAFVVRSGSGQLQQHVTGRSSFS